MLVAGEKEKSLLEEAIKLFRKNLGWDNLDEIKFHKTNKNNVKKLIEFIKDVDYSVYAIVLDKDNVPQELRREDKMSLYNHVIKELLVKLELSETIIEIDGIGGKKYMQKVRSYLRQSLRDEGVINCQIRFVDSKKSLLIQLADIMAGSIARSYQTDKKDAGDFVSLIGKKIKKIFVMK